MTNMRDPFNIAKDRFGSRPLIIAEIGVAFGDNAISVYEGLEPAEFHLIDSWEWGPVQRNVHDPKLYTADEMQEIARGKLEHLSGVTIVNSPSDSASFLYEDSFFDLVYIDGDHSYEGCASDLKLWHPKVKSGGIFCGDDYFYHPGVLQAVTEFFEGTGLEVHTGHSKTQWWVFKE